MQIPRLAALARDDTLPVIPSAVEGSALTAEVQIPRLAALARDDRHSLRSLGMTAHSLRSRDETMGRRRMRRAALLPLVMAMSCKGAMGHVDGPPVRLVAGIHDTIVVNEYLATRLPVRALDSAGHDVPVTGMRYRQTSGDPIALSALGIIRCDRSADTDVRATLGALSTNLHVLCRPVSDLRTMGSASLVVGDSATDLSIRALGPDSEIVAPLAGSVVVDDANVASVQGLRVTARQPGMTEVHVRIGNFSRGVVVTTYERVSSLEGLRAEQRNVLVPVRLVRGEMRRWRVPRGFYLITMSRASSVVDAPTLELSGASCGKGIGPSSYLCRATSAMTVIAYRSPSARSGAIGQIAMRRIEP